MVFIPSDLEQAKILTTAVYGGTLVAVDGNYDDVNRLCGELVETDEYEDMAFVNVNVRPYYAEGSKTLGLRGRRAARLAAARPASSRSAAAGKSSPSFRPPPGVVQWLPFGGPSS